MPTIKEAAKSYISKQTKNIAELKTVSVDNAILEGIANEGKDNEFSYNYIVVDGDEYRMPDSVLKDLKAILEKKPSLRNFSVSKQGSGMNTKYTVIPLD
jgi:hypothetical protein